MTHMGFESCEMEFRHSRCIEQGSVESQFLWMKLAGVHV